MTTESEPRHLRTLTTRRPVVSYVITLILAIYGITLLTQSDRWAKTPAYVNLLNIATADTWGIAYCLVAIAMMIGLASWHTRVIPLGAHTMAFVLLVSWEAAFVVRYFTDAHTTIANVMSWGAYLFLVIRSGMGIDRHVTE